MPNLPQTQGCPLSPPQRPGIETQRGTHPKPLYSTLSFHSFSTDGHIHFTTKKGTPPFYFYSVFLPSRVLAMPTSPHKRTLYMMLAYHFILHTQVAPISNSRLPATLCPLYLYLFFSLSSPTLPIASHMNPHHRLCSQFATRRRQAPLTS